MKRIFLLWILLLGLSGCAVQQQMEAAPAAESPVPVSAAAVASSPTQKPKLTPTPDPTSIPTPDPTPTPDPWEGIFTDAEIVKVKPQDSWSYTSPTLSVFIRQHFEDDCFSVFYTAHIYSCDPENFRTILWNEKTGRDVTQPENIARKYQAVFAQNGDFFFDSWNVALGPDIRNGVVFKETLGPDCMAVLNNGALYMFKKGRDAYSIEDFQKLGIQNTIAFGPIIVEGGKVCEDIKSHELFRRHPRSALGMAEVGHYVSILVDGRKPGISNGCTLERLAQEMIKEGCVNAYNLDGGQSTAMVFMGDQINDHENEVTSGQRRIPDMLMFGTSVLAKKLK